ncbi:DUF1549 and DUF1553 domain-containing protein [Lignipirellula cremea]|uniref:Bacterial Ig-like domain (Group 2) n=1 Tax=Lignipirellula cremea TaxID=2528010 RepID=A0A518E0E4_9BACT|nr:DUF1549 and DUF1553 domain-containing protein [Lignipirellula cremea]QDU97558.1 hypothetical protein Pla8534_54070 [Lignipirellula cremea]
MSKNQPRSQKPDQRPAVCNPAAACLLTAWCWLALLDPGATVAAAEPPAAPVPAVVDGQTPEPASAALLSVESLTALPGQVVLTGARSRQQLLLDGAVGDQRVDLTRAATYVSQQPEVAVVDEQGVVRPRGDGSAVIVARYQDHAVNIPVEVRQFDEPAPVEFATEVIAALSKAGCNVGACHGSPQGKGGFRLSLRGYDPQLDLRTLTREGYGRRTNRFDPDQSLVLRKPLGQTPHRGGVRLATNDINHQAIRSWIAEGCQQSESPRRLVRLQVLPDQRRLVSGQPQQQLIALAHFDNGEVQDVTERAVFTTNDEAGASVSADGRVEFHRTAEATFLVRYLSQVVGSRMTYVRHDPEFKFQSPPVVNFVDEHLFARQKELQIQPAGLATDAEFLRRVYLDTIGVPPTAEESIAFLDSADPDKRSQLIETLLQRDEFAAFWALKWADVMRGSEVTISRRGVHSFHRYLIDHFAADRPFDQFARETLTSLGDTVHKPAANFHRIARTPEDAAEAMSQLFMGVRIGCAKCHNHPFEAITQNDYYGLAAYFARIKFKGSQRGLDHEVVYLDRRSEVKHPVTNQNVAPVAFGVEPGELTDDDDRREKLLEWLTAPENPYFARSIVNRVWFHLLGRGIVDPVDDFRDTNPPANEELLAALAEHFVEQGYRIKPVVRVILNSSAYQLSSRSPSHVSPFSADPEPQFAQALIGMRTAEQILDSISAATGVPEKFDGYPPGLRAMELADGAVDHAFLKAFSKPVRDATCECGRDGDPSLSQVIHLLNNPEMLANMKSPGGHIARWLAAGKTEAQVVELIYLTTLSRRPTLAERELLEQHLSKATDRQEGLYDIQHALLNSHEFLLRH